MEIANPAALWGLIALAIVFVLPRLRLPRSRLRVANMFLWREALTSEQPRFTTRIRRNLLLILQAAAVAAIVLALAEPAWVMRGGTVAVVVDVSLSMGARDGSGTRLDAAKRSLLKRLESLSWGSRVRLMRAGHTTDLLGEFGGSSRTLRAAIERLETTAASSSLVDAVGAARAATPDGIIVITDQSRPKDVSNVEWITIGAPVDNLAISALTVRRLPASPLDAELFVEINNFGSPRDMSVVVQEDGRDVYHHSAWFGPATTYALLLRIPEPRGVLSAKIRLNRDALAADDVRFALSRGTPRVPVTLVSRGSFFLQRALTSHPALDVRVASEPGALRDGVLVCDGCDAFSTTDRGVLLVGRPDRNAVDVPLTVVDARHPLMAHLTGSHVSVRPAGSPPIPADAHVLATAGGAPVIAALERDGRRAVIAAIDLNSGAFPLDASYPLFIAQTVEWLAQDLDSTSVVAGEPARWKAEAPGDLAVTTPDGKVLHGRLAAGYATFGDTTVPGVYTIADGRRFVVNAAAAESNLRQAGGAATVNDASTSTAASPAAMSVRSSVPLASILLLMAATVVLLEWRVYCRARAV